MVDQSKSLLRCSTNGRGLMRIHIAAILPFGLLFVSNPASARHGVAVPALHPVAINLVTATPAKRFLSDRGRTSSARIAIVDQGRVKWIAIDHLQRLPDETLVLVDQAGAPKEGTRVIVAEII
ncbi:hypothetical protein [Sphingomonas mollis]|uniref:Uncharacterized protein n=1 Tax=Sphingomonas mollis TaxID=2795726 RepID=A0ABS0XSG8_9SPHN|nr:hypothetical protein [Sphingomonas sp. BT553]MBJ6122995.1 hypothetical protein [Sphingomonas sp. BT553]